MSKCPGSGKVIKDRKKIMNPGNGSGPTAVCGYCHNRVSVTQVPWSHMKPGYTTYAPVTHEKESA
jgi:hypothetical protein